MTLRTDASAPVTPMPATRADAAVGSFQAQGQERRFGFGYGNSSGYGTRRSYVTPWGQARFRCA